MKPALGATLDMAKILGPSVFILCGFMLPTKVIFSLLGIGALVGLGFLWRTFYKERLRSAANRQEKS